MIDFKGTQIFIVYSDMEILSKFSVELIPFLYYKFGEEIKIKEELSNAIKHDATEVLNSQGVYFEPDDLKLKVVDGDLSSYYNNDIVVVASVDYFICNSRVMNNKGEQNYDE